ncbi:MULTISPECIES: cellulose synthase [unclassified Sinorhizobium]|uniref:cellulose synthase n=1 Tax=unclassified Sinorhizobium TaxID=2613772 RepID=UPI00352695E4
MKSSLITLSVAAVTASIVIGVREGDAITGKLENFLGRPLHPPQLMLKGTIGSPDFRLLEKRDRVIKVAEMVGEKEPLVAQATPAPSPGPPAAPPQQPAVDESALRYFASRGDTARLQAEISRLRALYPNWTPPADPLAVQPSGDRQLEAMWQLYADARFAELRKAIADRQAAEPGWQPPADLLDRLDVAEARARLINASDLKQYQTVVDIGAATPSILTCSEVDVLWRVAEALANTQRPQRARDAYLYILKNCENPAERIATIQKASVLLPYPAMQELLSQERPRPDGGREFESIRDDLARRFVAEANEDPKLTIAPDYLIRLEHLVETQGLASDALLLGWYNLRRNNATEAEKWFRMARAKEDSASASQGLALVLIDRKAPQEAEDVMYKWRDSSKDATATYLAATANLLALEPPVALQPDILQRIAAEVIKQRDPETAQQFGWYARALNQPQTAARWFETALRWKPDDEPSAYGLAITRDQLNDRRGVAEIQRLWQGRSPRIANLREVTPPEAGPQAPLPPSGPVVQQQAPAAPPQAVVRYRRPAETVSIRRGPRQPRGCSTTIDPRRLSPGDALSRGWCLMDINRPMEAAAAFEVALGSSRGSAREDAAYGQSLAYLRVGLTSKAAVAAAKAPLSRQRASELQTAILTDRATAAFDAGRYREALMFLDQRAQFQRERIDLMVLRGYAYMNLKMYGDANRVFEAAAATGNPDAMRGLADVRNARFGGLK